MPTFSPCSGLCSASYSTDSDFIAVTIDVPSNHRLLLLRNVLPWKRVEELLCRWWRAAGKNIDGGRGRRFDLPLYTRAMVLMLLLRLDSRGLERELKENAVARLFVQVKHPTETLFRDHSNLDRAYRALTAEGLLELEHFIVQIATELGFTDGTELSSDTTCQRAHIGYPNEASLLRQVGARVVRLLRRVAKAGFAVAKEATEPAKKLFGLVKHYHLFAKGREEKREILEQCIQWLEKLICTANSLSQRLCPRKDGVLRRAGAKLAGLVSFTGRVVPQIRYWIRTGKVAAGKLLHPGIQEARAIAVNKAGGKWAYGFKWLISRLQGGYVVGKKFFKAPAEQQMPLEALDGYQEIYGEESTPEIAVYDRGGHSSETVQCLSERKVRKIGIVPKGKASWQVGEADRATVMKLRGMTEGVIGTLKGSKYQFDRPKQRSTPTVEMAGHASVVSFDLNKLLRDMEK